MKINKTIFNYMHLLRSGSLESAMRLSPCCVHSGANVEKCSGPRILAKTPSVSV